MFNCLTEEELWLAADSENDVDSLCDPAVHAHLIACSQCRERVDDLVEDKELIHRMADDVFHYLPIAPGEFLGKYEIRALIDRGGQGAVYRAYDRFLRREVAIKMGWAKISSTVSVATVGTSPHAESEAQIVISQLQHEGILRAQIEHPNLAAIYECGVHQGHPYLVMEYVAGMNLQQLVATQKLSPQRIRDIICQVSAAVDVAHGKGILHLDLKPENIIFGEHGKCKLIDFGIGHMLPKKRHVDYCLAGTLEYMAPEQRSGKRHEWTSRTDVYGLGAILFFLLTGQAPPSDILEESELREMLTRMNSNRNLRRVCMRAMSPHPEDRFPDAYSVRKHLLGRGKHVAQACIVLGVILLLAGLFALDLKQGNSTIRSGPHRTTAHPRAFAAADPNDPATLSLTTYTLHDETLMFACWTPQTGVFDIACQSCRLHDEYLKWELGDLRSPTRIKNTDGAVGIVAVQSKRAAEVLKPFITHAFRNASELVREFQVYDQLTIRLGAVELNDLPQNVTITRTVQQIHDRMACLGEPFEVRIIFTSAGVQAPHYHFDNMLCRPGLQPMVFDSALVHVNESER